MWDESFGFAVDEIEERAEESWNRMLADLLAGLRAARERLMPGGLLCVNIGDALRSPRGRFRRFPNGGALEIGIAGMDLELLPAINWYKPTNAPTKFLGSGMLPGAAYVTLGHERIILARCPGERRDTRYRSERRASAVFWAERNRFYSDHWQLSAATQSPVASSERRSAAFPPELAFRLILMYSVYGDTVLDPYGGTGTTGIAAMAAARNSVCVERDPALVDAALDRLGTAESLSWGRDRVAQRLGDRGDGNHRNRFYGAVHTTQETDLELRPPLRFVSDRSDTAVIPPACMEENLVSVEHTTPIPMEG